MDFCFISISMCIEDNTNFTFLIQLTAMAMSFGTQKHVQKNVQKQILKNLISQEQWFQNIEEPALTSQSRTKIYRNVCFYQMSLCIWPGYLACLTPLA